jgi:hypothetical protein
MPTPLPSSSLASNNQLARLAAFLLPLLSVNQPGQSASNSYPAAMGAEYQVTKNLLGLPTSGYYTATTSPQGTTGIYQTYANGTIHWTPKYGAVALWYDLQREYQQYSSPNGSGGWLGFPTKREYAWNGGMRTDFEGGYIFWDGQRAKAYRHSESPQPKNSVTINGYTVSGKFYPVYQNYQGTLGSPNSHVQAFSSSVTYQTFQNGSIVDSPRGTFPLYGAIRQKYLSVGGLNGRLGAPTSGEIGLGNGVIKQEFENGYIIWNGKAVSVYEGRYNSPGQTSSSSPPNGPVALISTKIEVLDSSSYKNSDSKKQSKQGFVMHNIVKIEGPKKYVWFGESKPYHTSLEVRSGIIVEDWTYKHAGNGTATLSGTFMNSGIDSGVVQVYDSSGKLLESHFLVAAETPTDILSLGGELFLKYPSTFFNEYSLIDVRDRLEPKVIELNIPKGGEVVISKKAMLAQAYNLAVLLLNTWKLRSWLNKGVSQELISKSELGLETKDEGFKAFVKLFAAELTKRGITNLLYGTPSLKTPIESYINPKALEAFHNAVSEFVSNPDMFGKTLVGSTREVFSEIFSEGVVNALKKYKDTLAKYSKFGGQLALLVEGVDLGGQVANIFALALGIANMQNAGEKAEMLIINDV